VRNCYKLIVIYVVGQPIPELLFTLGLLPWDPGTSEDTEPSGEEEEETDETQEASRDEFINAVLELLEKQVSDLGLDDSTEFPPDVDEDYNYRCFAETVKLLDPSRFQVIDVCCCCGVGLPCVINPEIALFDGTFFLLLSLIQ
jgi:hypothetical protein